MVKVYIAVVTRQFYGSPRLHDQTESHFQQFYNPQEQTEVLKR